MKLLATVLAVVSFAAVADECPPKARLVGGDTVITPCNLTLKGALKSGQPYQLILREAKYQRKKGDKPDDGSLWGIDGGFPWTKVTELSLVIKAYRVNLPKKFYSDLTNISSVSVIERNGDIIISVEGGDAAGSFEGEFVVRDTRFVERTIRAGEAPEELWEKVVYHNAF